MASGATEPAAQTGDHSAVKTLGLQEMTLEMPVRSEADPPSSAPIKHRTASKFVSFLNAVLCDGTIMFRGLGKAGLSLACFAMSTKILGHF